MAELRWRQARAVEVATLLSPVLARFVEDLMRGSRLLDTLETCCTPAHVVQRLPCCDALPDLERARLCRG